MGGKLGVGVGHAVDLALNKRLVEWVKEDALVGAGILSDSDGTSSNAGWADDVVEDGLVDSLESSRSWAHLGGVGLGYILRQFRTCTLECSKHERKYLKLFAYLSWTG